MDDGGVGVILAEERSRPCGVVSIGKSHMVFGDVAIARGGQGEGMRLLRWLTRGDDISGILSMFADR